MSAIPKVGRLHSLLSRCPWKGECYYESNRIQDALPYLLSAINEAIDSGCPGALVPAITTIARIKRAQGDMNGALHVVQEYEGWLEKKGKPHWIYLLNAFKTRLHIDSGGTEKVEKWFASCKLGIYHEISRAAVTFFVLISPISIN